MEVGKDVPRGELEPESEPEPDPYPENGALAREIIDSLGFGPDPSPKRATAEGQARSVLNEVLGGLFGRFITKTHI